MISSYKIKNFTKTIHYNLSSQYDMTNVLIDLTINVVDNNNLKSFVIIVGDFKGYGRLFKIAPYKYNILYRINKIKSGINNIKIYLSEE